MVELKELLCNQALVKLQGPSLDNPAIWVDVEIELMPTCSQQMSLKRRPKPMQPIQSKWTLMRLKNNRMAGAQRDSRGTICVNDRDKSDQSVVIVVS